MPAPYPEPIQDKSLRAPEWELLEPGYGQGPMLRQIEWDWIHDEIRKTGPKIDVHPPVRPE